MEIVINAGHGGFSLSREGVLLGRKLSNNENWGGACIVGDIYSDGKECTMDFGFVTVERNDPILVQVVKKLKRKANGDCASLKIVEIPNNVEWEIQEYDGAEWIAEKHRTWS
jgi:hypothetical protein